MPSSFGLKEGFKPPRQTLGLQILRSQRETKRERKGEKHQCESETLIICLLNVSTGDQACNPDRELNLRPFSA
ncbi:hypothetical protein D623_10028515 [Myotis brandtii]|uniref:Uncharacterized protein n=1 Tax=Myotis brandtii TaxID=109478 RepID=S7MQ65_MYOBR|nr:hypothetical protein D623_10028515 [Myotis brandtii]